MSRSVVLRCLSFSKINFVASSIVRGFEIQRYALLHYGFFCGVISRESLEHKTSFSFFSIANFSSKPNISPPHACTLGIIDEEMKCADQFDEHGAVQEMPELFPLEMQVKSSASLSGSMRSYHQEGIDVLVSTPGPFIGNEHENNISIEDHDVGNEEGDSLEFCCSNHDDDLVSDRYSYRENNESVELLSYEGSDFRKEEIEGYHGNHKPKVGWQGERFYLLKSRGQHLLTNPRVLDSIVQKARVLPTDTVLEIGPGTGNLTVGLLEYARKVIAVEIDERMVDTLQNRIGKLGLEDKISVIKGNVLKMELPHFDLCVSNIPYGISSQIIAKLFLMPHKSCFRSATLLLQKEFARRLLAKPGEPDFNRLAVNVGLVASVNFLMNVSKRDFVPCPKVDSCLVQIQPKPNIPDINLDEWSGFTRTCFSKRNKTLGAIFKQKKKIIELYEKSQSSSAGFKSYENEDHASEYYVDENNETKYGDVGRNLKLEEQSSTEILSFREKIVRILKDGGFGEKRPSKLSNEEFLCLLDLFNKEGVFFR